MESDMCKMKQRIVVLDEWEEKKLNFHFSTVLLSIDEAHFVLTLAVTDFCSYSIFVI